MTIASVREVLAKYSKLSTVLDLPNTQIHFCIVSDYKRVRMLDKLWLTIERKVFSHDHPIKTLSTRKPHKFRRNAQISRLIIEKYVGSIETASNIVGRKRKRLEVLCSYRRKQFDYVISDTDTLTYNNSEVTVYSGEICLQHSRHVCYRKFWNLTEYLGWSAKSFNFNMTWRRDFPSYNIKGILGDYRTRIGLIDRWSVQSIHLCWEIHIATTWRKSMGDPFSWKF